MYLAIILESLVVVGSPRHGDEDEGALLAHEERRSLRPASFAPTEAKLRPPSRPDGLVPRTALIDRLVDMPSGGVVLITAPAGYGKSVLAGQWAEEDPRPFAWLTADAGDNDPRVLITYLLMALHRVEPLDADLLAAVAQQPDKQLVDAVGPLVSRMLRGRQPFALVVDDVDALTERRGRRLLRTVSDNLPPQAQLVLVGRVAPKLTTSTRTKEQRPVTIGPAELRLTRVEAHALVAGTGLALPYDAADTLFDRAEGWAAGMYLGALSLAADAAGRESPDSVAGSDELIAGYLDEELLDRLPPDDRLFLLRTSVLHELCAPLCDAVLSATSSAGTLKRLLEADVLLDRTDREDGDWFRLHPLLREALLAALQRQEPRALGALNRRASHWLESHGDAGASIEHATAARDVERAARLIWTEVPRCLANGDVAKLDGWLDAYTPRQIARYAKLALTTAWCALHRGLPVDHWIAFAEQGSYETARNGEQASVQSAAALLRAVVARSGVARMGADAQQALDLQPPGDQWASAAGLFTALSSSLTGRGEPRAGLEHAEEAARVDESHHVRVLALTELSRLSGDDNDWDAARARSDRAMTVMHEHRLDDVALLASAHCNAALVAAQRQSAERATPVVAHAHRMLASVVETPAWSGVRSREQLARAELSLGNASAARAVLSEAQTLARQAGDEALRENVELAWRRIATHPLDMRNGSTLTPAELRVLQLLPTHLSFGQIGEQLFVSRNTVKTQAVSAYRKLGVTSRREAVEKGVALGLVLPTQHGERPVTRSG